MNTWSKWSFSKLITSKKKQNTGIRLTQKNSELKNVHEYARATSYGIDSMANSGYNDYFHGKLEKNPQINELTDQTAIKIPKIPKIPYIKD